GPRDDSEGAQPRVHRALRGQVQTGDDFDKLPEDIAQAVGVAVERSPETRDVWFANRALYEQMAAEDLLLVLDDFAWTIFAFRAAKTLDDDVSAAAARTTAAGALVDVVERLTVVMADLEDIPAWLLRPLDVLDGHAPITQLTEGPQGIERVRRLVSGLEDPGAT
ncbi:MAG: hypothetical protein QOE05_1711, partial [Actinomycetota bacterium]|nr:hypothetical protein [Actinomycetota bacterium]